jgi:hypothetical protein
MELLIRVTPLRSYARQADASPARQDEGRDDRALTRQELQDLFGPELRTIKPLTHAA